ncbi:hypothetical protein QN277_012634 [Acacia crassicarpa]|uniref:Uncharacterized protein n=1 Tax=Acacia crassicarpa TaxID=499986 RepID=A0AAE1TD87_9FABA|nr:hypothetical protein QN277_012634 [Acacia crassicarpa]
MDMKGTVDVSCYLCFEATGDSEAPSCDPINKDPNIACRIPIWDDDDAQSCCYDASDESLIHADELINIGYESDDKERTEEEDDDDEVEVCVYGTTYKEEQDDCKMQEEKKLRVCVNSGADQKIDEVEKNRLFWEACLAS